MPLVVPGITSDPKDKAEEWKNKLTGKTISDNTSDETNFCKKDLPEQHRVLEPGTITTREFIENRLNVHLSEDGKVSHVTYG